MEHTLLYVRWTHQLFIVIHHTPTQKAVIPLLVLYVDRGGAMYPRVIRFFGDDVQKLHAMLMLSARWIPAEKYRQFLQWAAFHR